MAENSGKSINPDILVICMPRRDCITMLMRVRGDLEAEINCDGVLWRTTSISEGGFDGVRHRVHGMSQGLDTVL